MLAPRDFPFLLLLPVDPWRLHVYWWIAPLENDRLQRSLRLRLFWRNPHCIASTAAAPRYWEIGPVALRDDMQVSLPLSGTVYTVALGHGDPMRGFVEVARSAPVEVPLQTARRSHELPSFDEAAIDAAIRATLPHQPRAKENASPATDSETQDHALCAEAGISSTAAYVTMRGTPPLRCSEVG